MTQFLQLAVKIKVIIYFFIISAPPYLSFIIRVSSSSFFVSKYPEAHSEESASPASPSQVERENQKLDPSLGMTLQMTSTHCSSWILIFVWSAGDLLAVALVLVVHISLGSALGPSYGLRFQLSELKFTLSYTEVWLWAAVASSSTVSTKNTQLIFTLLPLTSSLNPWGLFIWHGLQSGFF